MATFQTFGSDGLIQACKRIMDIPDSIKAEALNEMAKIAANAEKETGERMRVRDPNSNVHILDNIKINKPKMSDTGGSVTITFAGTRPNGNKTIRNAEIAFIQEYGTDTIPARPFIREAMESSADNIGKVGEKILQDYIEKTYSE